MINFLDVFYILKWFLAFFVIGLSFLPLTFSVFKDFKDKGYIFSKIIGIALITYLVFIIGILKLFKFSELLILGLLFLLFLFNYSLFKYKKIDFLSIVKKNYKLFILEEIFFLTTLFFWTFVRSNLPDIHGLEKFMDFGFLNSILRADYFPPKDMWYTPLSINYYYFGHLITAVLTKFTQIPSLISYNLMLSTLFALTFTASFSLGLNLFDITKFSKKIRLSGLISAIFVTFAGNLTTIYSFFKSYGNENPVPFWQLPFLPITFPNGYWYPNATRFIPFTIHEFPLYSFVVADLHGHVLDIPFVLLTIALIFSFVKKETISLLDILFISFLLSVMYMTNAWDGLIYLLLSIIFITTYTFYKNNKWVFSYDGLYDIFKKSIIIIAGFFAFTFPFSINFKPFVSGIGFICAPTFLTKIERLGPFLFEPNHCQRSPIWQLFILYGFFYFFVFSFIAFLKIKKNYKITGSDLFVLMLILLSTVLIVVPEFVYIKDIYPMHYRANTMFKLTYESFIMLSLSSSFILVKLLSNIKSKKILIPFFLTSVILVFLILIYPFFAINSYYKDLKNYQSLNGLKYLSKTYPGDLKLVNWINQNLKGQPVILEASGDSYTDYARISTNTGLPTVIGWSVHEWLWRGTYDLVSPRIKDVETIYTSNDIQKIKKLIKIYNIEYIVVSYLEIQKYNKLNEENFLKFGEIIYKDKTTKLYKINSWALD